MADATLGLVVHHVRQLSAAATLSDGELLEAYLGRQEADAFAALARRHGPMVWGVCRRVLGHEQDAEDAFQATFVLLAQKAASVRDRAALAGWLYGAAYRAALSIKRSATRRRCHERQARPAVPAGPLAELSWREIEGVLEEEMQQLGEKPRMAFVLCCLEGLSRAEAASRLGVPEGTVSSRLAEARQQLQRRLARRGVRLSAVLAAVAVAQPGGASVVPPGLLATTVRAAAGGIVSARVAGLVEGGLRTTALARWKLVGALTLTLGMIAAGAGLIARPNPAGPPTGTRASQPTPADQPRPAAVLHPGKDLHGDPLPPGAIARLGTVRFRHGSNVTALAFAPDGKTLLSVSVDRTLRAWEAATGRELLRRETATRQDNLFLMPGSPGSRSGYDLSLSADGKTVAVLSQGVLSLGEPTAARFTRSPLPAVAFRTCAVVSPDGKTLAAGHTDGTVRLGEAATGKLLHECSGHKGGVQRVAFAPDGKSLVSCGEDGTVRLWDVQSGKETLRLERKQAVATVAFSGDGQFLAAGGADGTLCLWRLPAGKLLHELKIARLDGFEMVAFSPDRKTVAASLSHHVIHLWDLTTGKLLRRLGGSSAVIAFSPDGRTLVTGGTDNLIRLWDVATGKECTPPAAGHLSPVWTVAVADDGTVATCGWNDRLIRLWEAATGKELRLLRGPTAYPLRMTLSPDGKIIASNYGLWDRATGKELGRFKAQDDGIEVMTFRPDGRTLATAADRAGRGKGGTIRLCDVATLKEQKQFGTQRVRALSYAPDGKTLAAGNEDGTVCLWDVATGREVRRFEGHRRWVYSVAFSPDGKALASSSLTSGIFLWDVATGKELRSLGRRPGRRDRGRPAHAVAFAPNGKMLASADMPSVSEEDCITLWEVATGQVRLRLTGHQGRVSSLAFAPNGRTLVSGSFDTTALVWDVLGPPQPAPAGGLAGLWDDLLSADAARAYRAMGTLATSPEGARFLGQRLSGATTPDRRRVAQLIKELDSSVFAEREKASQALEQLGEGVEAALRQALTDRPSPEMRSRLERLVAKLDAGWLRSQRAVEMLELAGTPAVKKVLQALASGAPEARLTQEAKAALARLRR